VAVLLVHDLAHEDGVGLFLHRVVHELLVQHLRAEVARVEALVTFEAVVTLVALHVEDRVDADRVRVEPGRGAHDDQFPADLLADNLVDFVHALELGLDLEHVDLGEIDRVVHRAVADEKAEALGRLFHRDDLDVVEAHLAHDLARGFFRFGGGVHG
jgi:hypothetical protein